MFSFYGKLRAMEIYLNKAAVNLLSPKFKLFKKQGGLELVTLPHFLHNFWRKVFILLCSINWRNFIVWLLLLCEILGNMCIGIVCKPVCDVINFDVNLIFLIKLFFLHDQTAVRKTFFIISKGLSIKEIAEFFRRVRVPL